MITIFIPDPLCNNILRIVYVLNFNIIIFDDDFVSQMKTSCKTTYLHFTGEVKYHISVFYNRLILPVKEHLVPHRGFVNCIPVSVCFEYLNANTSSESCMINFCIRIYKDFIYDL